MKGKEKLCMIMHTNSDLEKEMRWVNWEEWCTLPVLGMILLKCVMILILILFLKSIVILIL